MDTNCQVIMLTLIFLTYDVFFYKKESICAYQNVLLICKPKYNKPRSGQNSYVNFTIADST